MQEVDDAEHQTAGNLLNGQIQLAKARSHAYQKLRASNNRTESWRDRNHSVRIAHVQLSGQVSRANCGSHLLLIDAVELVLVMVMSAVLLVYGRRYSAWITLAQ